MSILSIGFFEARLERSARLNDLFNEVIIVLTLYTMMCFTFFIPDEIMRFYLGYFSCFLVVIHLLVNLSIMLVGSMQKLILNLKRLLYRLKVKYQKQRGIIPQNSDSKPRTAEVRKIAFKKEIVPA